jgi:DUF4097 and DUF4098 domain-containing protein YvlB
MPRQARLVVKVFSSDVHVRNVGGDQNLETFSGDLRVEQGPARIDAKTFSGDVKIGK